MNAKVLLCVGLMLLGLPAHAQGFAGLGQGGEGFALPQAGAEFTFPEDHGPHPDYRIEWWYLTATVEDASGTPFGLQWTLFRSALSPEGPQVWMGHFGLTSPDHHHSGEKFARGGLGQAGVTAAPFNAWIDDWALAGPDMDALRLQARTDDAGYDVQLQAQGPLVFHGDAGFSVKSPSGQASYYYSQPFYDVTGTLHLPDGPVEVTGQGWLDREWSSQPLEADQEGWDWFSLYFEGGDRLMAFRLRGATEFSYASWITATGTLIPYPDGAVTLTPTVMSPVAGRSVPTAWRLEMPARDLDVSVTALNPQSWQGTLFPYWEGPVVATGSHAGEGYLEMTGYD